MKPELFLILLEKMSELCITFKEQMLIEALKGRDIAHAYVGKEVMEYINTRLSHEDCLTCIAILKKNVESILT